MSLRKRVSTNFRGAWPGRNPGTCAVGINSVNSLSKYRSMSSRGTVTVTCRWHVLRVSTFTSRASGCAFSSSWPSVAFRQGGLAGVQLGFGRSCFSVSAIMVFISQS